MAASMGRAPQRTVAAAVLLLLAFGPAFVPSTLSKRSSSPTLEAKTFLPTSEPTYWQSEQQARSQAGAGATCIAVVALLATALRTRASSRPSRGNFKAVLLSEGSLEPSSTSATSSTFAGASLGKVDDTSRSKVTVNSLKSCDTLYFRRYWQYKSRHRKNLRNRAYNIFQKNKYKKEMKKVLRYAEDLRANDVQPESVDQVMSEIKEKLDEACYVIDAVAVQGVLHRNDAADCKERMCIYILKACVKKGLLTMPEDPFEPAYKEVYFESRATPLAASSLEVPLDAPEGVLDLQQQHKTGSRQQTTNNNSKKNNNNKNILPYNTLTVLTVV
ncbi:unnamed protein product [Polarella glacialis]|uniref:Uncharacterized protein n=1 Tax=Polarella glacialis TaxID=89957 RepID=A0A813E7D5_POLGL|nr:unnamed protein product [Polarella glacialis]